jgi:hypothetical protein
MRAMRAEAFNGYKDLKLVDVPKPLVIDGKVLVRITAAGVTPLDYTRTPPYSFSGGRSGPTRSGSGPPHPQILLLIHNSLRQISRLEAAVSPGQ